MRTRLLTLVSLGLTLALAAGPASARTTAKVPNQQAKKKKADPTVPPITRDQVELVFVLDTTGSMGGLIAGAKKKIWFIANEVLKSKRQPGLKVGLVAYRDKGDAYVTQTLALTDDLDKVYTTLMGYRAGGGGDGPEDVNAGLDAAVSDQPWSKNKDTLKLVFLVGDAEPHMDYAGKRKHPEISRDALKKNIYIHTIQCGSSGATQTAWKTIARNSEGRYAAIKQHGGVVAKATPFDAELGRLAGEMDATSVDIGTRTARREKKSVRTSAGGLAAAAPMSTRAERALVKAKTRASTDDDMVSLYEEKGEAAVVALGSGLLNDEMSKQSKKDRIATVKKKSKARKALRHQIQTIEKKRDAYLAKEAAAAPPAEMGFDSEVAATLADALK